MDNKIFITTWKDKITILEDKYEQMDDNDYKKRQLGIKIADLKSMSQMCYGLKVHIVKKLATRR